MTVRAPTTERGDTPASDAGIDHEVALFSPPPSRRSFAPGPLVRLAGGVGLVLVGAVVAAILQSTIEGVEDDLSGALARLPNGLESALVSVAQVVTSFVPLVTVVVLLVRRRWRVALLLVVTGAVASLGMVLADALVINRDLASFLAQLRADDNSTRSTYPTSQVIAATVAVVSVAAPWLSRRWRRTLWYAVAVLVLLRLLAVAQPAFDLVLALGVGTVAGALMLLLFGTPTNEPRPEELLDALRSDGFDPRRIDRLEPEGDVLHYEVTEDDGTRRALALRTPTERDADLFPRLYRRLRFRSSEVGIAYATLKRRLEHEALILALARQARVHAPRVVRIGVTARGSAYLVTEDGDTQPLTPDELNDPSILEQVWTQVGALHDAGLAHRRLALEALRLDADGRVGLVGFDAAQTAPEEREVARDVAAVLTETALVVGAAAAVEAAVSVLGSERVAPALRMLQPLALPPATRARAKEEGHLLEDLRREVNADTGEPGLELEDLERIKPRTLLIIGASTLAFYSLLPQLANIDSTVDSFSRAQPVWILAAVLASVVTYLFAAVAFQGAVTAPIPFGPNVRAQVASSFAGLVGPAGAGGFALNARFLERLGVPAAEAGGSVAVNALAGFMIHMTFLVGFVLWAGSSGIGDVSLPDRSLVLLVAAGILVLLGVAMAIGPVRRRVVAPAWATLRTGLAQIGRTFQNPGRVAALFGGSAGLTLAYVVGVVCCVEAFGGGLSIPQIGAAYLGAVVVASIAPTPGGLGAVESAMIAGFVAFGLADSVAVSATLTFRLATFWLPLLPGWLSLGWMQRNDEL